MSESKPTLSKTQRELLDALSSGVVVLFKPYAGRFNPQAYWFRSDTMRPCTAAADALIAKGYAEEFNKDWRGAKLRAKATGEQA